MSPSGSDHYAALQARIADLEQQLHQCQVERQQAEARQHSESRPETDQMIRFQANLLNHVQNAVICTDVAGRVTYWNRFAEILYQWTADEVVGCLLLDLFAPPGQTSLLVAGLEKLQQFHHSEGERLIKRRDGKLITVLFSTTALRNDSDQVVGFVGISVDITDRKATETALLRSEQKVATILASITDAFLSLDEQWQFTYLNPQAEVLLKRSAQELLGKNIWEEFSDALSSDFYHQYHYAMTQQQSVAFETFYAPFNAWYEVRAYPYEGGISVYMRNISDRKRAELELQQLNHELELRVQQRTQELLQSQSAQQQSEALFRRLFEGAPIGIGIGLLNQNHLFRVNQMFCQMLDYSAEKLTQLPFLRFTHPDDLVVSMHLRDQLAAGTVPNYQIEKRYIKATGEVFWVSLTATILQSPSDGQRYRLVMVQDITKRKQAEATLQKSESRLSLALTGAKAGIWEWDTTTNTGFWSDENFRLLGYEPGSCQPSYDSWLAAVHPVDRQRVAAATAQALQNHSDLTLEYRVLLPDDSLRWIYSIGQIVCDEHRQSKGLHGLQLDISDRKLAEASIQEQSQREQLLRIITQRIRQSLNLDAILTTAVTEVRQTLRADRALIFRLLPDETGHIIKEAVLPQYPSLGEGIWIDACLSSNSIKHYCVGQPRIVADVALDEWGQCLGKFLQQIGVRSKISAPIIQTLEDGSTQVWGLLIVHACTRYRQWVPEDAGFLQQISNQLALAIQQSVLYQRVQTELAERKQAEAQLRTSLQEKEVLLKEVHHRVKNNMQVISSLLNLQADSIQDPKILAPFVESQRRVKAMALIHEKLYRTDNLARINFAEYVQELVDDLSQSHTTPLSAIQLLVEVDNIELAVDVAIPCGLIINELVSNAFKHAFPAGRSGEILVAFSTYGTQQHRLIVKDNGIGIPKSLDFLHTKSLGLQLINAFTKKLQGTLELKCDRGSTFNITF